MAVEIKDLEILDISSMDELKDGEKTIIPMQSTIDKANAKFQIELEKQCADIGMVPCVCTPPQVSTITGELLMPTPGELVNSYSYHALVETQGEVYAKTQCLVKCCKKCGKMELFGNPTMVLMGLSTFYNAMLNLEDCKVVDSEEGPVDESAEEIIEEPIEDTETKIEDVEVVETTDSTTEQ